MKTPKLTPKAKITKDTLKKLGFDLEEENENWYGILTHSSSGAHYDLNVSAGILDPLFIDNRATVSDLMIAIAETARHEGREEAKLDMRQALGLKA